MNISELLASTHRVGNHSYGPKNTFDNKQLGKILLYNKTVRTKPDLSIIEVSMMIEAVTEKNMDHHRVMAAIYGVEQQRVTGRQLAAEMRRVKRGRKGIEEETDQSLIIEAIETKPFKDKTVIREGTEQGFPVSTEKDDEDQDLGYYIIVNDNVSKDNMIKVWCSCSSYYWTFLYYNVENDVDIFMKKPETYIPKTKKGFEAFTSNRPMRNPGRHPGMCKHLMLLFALLMDPIKSSSGSADQGGSNVMAEARGIVRAYKANIEKFEKAERMTEAEYNRIIEEYELQSLEREERRTEASMGPGVKTRRKYKGWQPGIEYIQKNQQWRKIPNKRVG